MTQANESTDYPQDEKYPAEPIRCTKCGNLLGFYSDRSEADLVLRCSKCSNDYDITLHEGASNYRRRNKKKAI